MESPVGKCQLRFMTWPAPGLIRIAVAATAAVDTRAQTQWNAAGRPAYWFGMVTVAAFPPADAFQVPPVMAPTTRMRDAAAHAPAPVAPCFVHSVCVSAV